MSKESENNHVQKTATAFAAGSAASWAELAIGQVLWRIKTIVQENPKMNVQQIAKMLMESKVHEIYRGISLNAACMAAITGTQMSVATQFQSDKQSTIQKIAAAFAGGAVGGVIAGPAEMTMRYMNIERGFTQTISHFFSNQGIVNGFRTLYKGTPATMARDGMFAVGYMELAKVIQQYSGASDTAFHKVISGVTAGIFVAMLSHPADAIQGRQQIHAKTSENMISTAQAIFREQGYKGFWTGGLWRTGRIAVAIPVMDYVSTLVNNSYKPRICG